MNFLIGYSKPEPMPFIWIGTAVARLLVGSPRHVQQSDPSRLQGEESRRGGCVLSHRVGGRRTDNGKPGPRGPAEMNIYGAYVIDPDGNNVEAGVRE